MSQAIYAVAYINFFDNVLKQKEQHYAHADNVPWKELAVHSGLLGTPKETREWLEHFPDEWDDKVCGSLFFDGDAQFTFTKITV